MRTRRIWMLSPLCGGTGTSPMPTAALRALRDWRSRSIRATTADRDTRRQDMFANVRGTRIYFDIEGAGLVPDGDRMRERPVAMVIHGGPGGEHSGFKPAMSPLAGRMQLLYFDHRGQGRSAH